MTKSRNEQFVRDNHRYIIDLDSLRAMLPDGWSAVEIRDGHDAEITVSTRNINIVSIETRGHDGSCDIRIADRFMAGEQKIWSFLAYTVDVAMTHEREIKEAHRALENAEIFKQLDNLPSAGFEVEP